MHRLLLLLVVPGCAEWPRFDHLPAGADDTARPVSERGEDEVEVIWTEVALAAEGANDDPRGLPAETLVTGRGNWVASQLDGAGWDELAEPVRAEECGHVSAFPPLDLGDYLGDVDWRVLNLQGTGTLCASLVAEGDDVRVDVLLYSLDECGLPVAVARYGSGEVVGFGAEGPSTTWAWPVVESGSRVAVVAAAFEPDDPQRRVPYRWAQVLLPAPEAGAGAPVECPTPPEEAR